RRGRLNWGSRTLGFWAISLVSSGRLSADGATRGAADLGVRDAGGTAGIVWLSRRRRTRSRARPRWTDAGSTSGSTGAMLYQCRDSFDGGRSLT
ncbi:MAG TPA: hypothetical protein VMT34_11865, partial [Aggregatilineales bacterium]|nr:hypothetical protein [Aggregatilineales bacterium]